MSLWKAQHLLVSQNRALIGYGHLTLSIPFILSMESARDTSNKGPLKGNKALPHISGLPLSTSTGLK